MHEDDEIRLRHMLDAACSGSLRIVSAIESLSSSRRKTHLLRQSVAARVVHVSTPDGSPHSAQPCR